MPKKAVLADDPLLSTRVVFEQLEILELPRESIAGESLGFSERFAVGSNTAAREIEGDRRQSTLGKLTRDVREERPVREALESVTDDHRAKRRLSAIDFSPDGETILAWDLERPGTYGRRRGHPSISPLMSAHP